MSLQRWLRIRACRMAPRTTCPRRSRPCTAAVQPRATAIEPRADAPAASRAVPTIVFHGDRDATVVPNNGAGIVQQAVSKLASERGTLTQQVEQREANGRRCTRTTHVDPDGLPVVEQWTVQGGGHAWFGGSSAGSFTESQGPDASRETMRFFYSHVKRESAAPLFAAA